MKNLFKRNQSSFRQTEFNQLLTVCTESSDFLTFRLHDDAPFFVSFYKTLINPDTVHQNILAALADKKLTDLQVIKEKLPIEDLMITTNIADIKDKLMTGHVVFHEKEKTTACLLVPAQAVEKRQVAVPETEYTVMGPKEAFVESLDTNVNLVRKRLPIPELQMKELVVGTLSKTRVKVAYIQGIADPENINTAIQRIQEIEYDQIPDSSFLMQMITDNKNSLFPQLIDTERPDRVASALAEGKIAILADGSPHVLLAPTTLVEFFSAFEDYFYTWIIASIFRLIRVFAVLFSVLSTPTYVAILTYHYEMIPQDLLNTLVSSRSGIPFPPILEALILELTIELLREAGARLPTKVGQTIGIVGGIVIGTAAVQAGLTSNVLLILVALSALASFTTPIYQVSYAIRFIRFPFFLFAQFLGLLGLVICGCFVLLHMLKLSSLGRPFLEPIFPLRRADLKDALFRLPFDQQRLRPLQVRTEQAERFDKQSPPENKPDIDE
ncbi:spore germination protein [Bacillus sp. REN10]|uniref:spore germination protein n=1 Tax=Bacillus sp. REN10 TaxID=2782541 RepID=UPI00193B1B84|nr:spore germination protein [Bacillus sp. REN10]